MAMFAEHMGVKVVRVNAADRYFAALEGVSDPEAKRKIIGNLFVEIFDEESNKLKNAKWLAQGTIYPDVIESAGSKTGKAHVIKSHHNVGGLPEHMKLGLVEPLRELFRTKCAAWASSSACRAPWSTAIRSRAGLGVRILGEVKREYAELLAKADAIFIDELRKADLYDKTSQAFAVFLPVKSVGVVGDARAYEWVIALRAVETIDFMTAHWAHLPYEFLGTVSNRIINELRGFQGLSMTSRGSRRLLLSGNELKNEGAERRLVVIELLIPQFRIGFGTCRDMYCFACYSSDASK